MIKHTSARVSAKLYMCAVRCVMMFGSRGPLLVDITQACLSLLREMLRTSGDSERKRQAAVSLLEDC